MPKSTIATVCTGVNVDFLVEEFVTDPGVPGAVDYPAGTAYRRIYARVNSGTARFHMQVYVRTSAGVETLVRDEYSPNFTDQTVALQEWLTVAPAAGAVAATDRIVNKLYAQRITGGGGTITVTTYFEGTSHGSHIQTTISAGGVGPQGPPGEGVPSGGITGQVLVKTSDTDYATTWQSLGTAALVDIHVGSSPPSSPTVGDIWIDTSEPAPEPYVAQAVHLNGNSYLNSDALDVEANPFGMISVWAKIPASSGTDFLNGSGGNIIIKYDSGDGVGIELWSADGSSKVAAYIDSPALTLGVWNHFLVAWDMDHVAGSRRLAVYINDVQISISGFLSETGSAFSPDFTSGGPMQAAWTSHSAAVDFADFSLWVGSTIVAADGTISETNRRKFIDASGKPVDPSNWPANPIIKFCGDASTFPVNAGTGGAFTLTGTLTNASTSPSD